MNKKLLFIGLNGFAEAGKDTVAKMIKTILGYNWSSLEECKNFYQKTYTNPTWSATYHASSLDNNNKVLCIAYADQLKMICSTIFGIPYERFYMNKANAWVCINDKFQYTEIKPISNYIITADEFYYGYDNYINNSEQYWMSLREILVYVGTYVLQKQINKNVFVNIVRNKILDEQNQNPNLEYVIITDNRFTHELNFIHENNGITISIIRNSIEQLNNVAEHDLDDVEDYDFVIDNSGTYDDLFEEVWNIVHNNIEFRNKTLSLYTRDNINNYLRLCYVNDDHAEWKLCCPYYIQKIYKNEDIIKLVDPIGGPTICINEYLDSSNGVLYVNQIEHIEDKNQFIIYTKRRN